jgi:hypothetical protein
VLPQFVNRAAADPAASPEVARLSVLFGPPWVISYRAVAGITIFTARRPGLAISKASSGALEDELWLWDTRPAARAEASAKDPRPGRPIP